MHHVAIVSSSFLSTVGQSSTVKSTIRVVLRTTMTMDKKDSVCGKCCCRKGKCKEPPGLSEDHGLFRNTLRSSQCRNSMPLQNSGHLRRFRRLFFTLLPHTDVFRSSPCYTMFSRSFTSAASIPKRQTATYSSQPSGTHGTRLSNFRDKNLPRSQSNLEELWDAFSALRNEDEMKILDAQEHFSFAGMIMRSTDAKGEVMTNSIKWGDRLECIVHELRRKSSPADALRLRCLSITALALQGRYEEAATALAATLQNRHSPVEHPRWILDTCRHTLRSFLRHGSPSQAIDFYLDNYGDLRQFVKESTAVYTLPRFYAQLFTELSAIFRSIDSPASFLAEKAGLWPKGRILSLGITMIRIFCQDGLAEDALEVYEELVRQKFTVLSYLEHALVRALAKAQRFERANLLYVAIAPKLSMQIQEARSYDATGLYLFAHQGDVERAEECFERLTECGGVSPQEMTLVMHASSKQGNAKRTVELFEEFFGKQDPTSEKSTSKPSIHHYNTLLNAFAANDDIDGMNYWLSRMLADGYTPDIAVYNVVLKGVAQRNDLTAVHRLLDQMREARVPPDVQSYNTVITTLARRRDVLGAEALFKRMLREGIALDRLAITTLMNAHVEAGSWRGVIRIFDYIRGSKLKELKLGIEVFNTLLKAYVLIGAPLEVISTIYGRLESTNIRPTNHTFALLIQAACNSERMDVAARLFVEMEALEKDWTTDVQVTKEVLTIIMSGYLRKGNRTQARAIYEDMQKRDIRPTAYTYASILRSYSIGAFDENVRTAQDFLDSLMAQPPESQTWAEPMSGRDSAMAYVFAPLMDVHTKKLDVEQVERLYQDFIDKGERPSIGTLALLMDVYRRTGDIEGVQRTWPLILQTAFDRTDEVDKLLHEIDTQSNFFRTRRRGDLLCLPLSMYIDALSYAGLHIEIAHTWNRLRDAGFQFDSHNWNHLVIALVRAGQPVRAFEVVEKVILPYQDEAHFIFRSRAKNVDSPLVFDDEEMRAEIEDEPFIRRVERSPQKLASLMQRVRRRFQGRNDTENDDLAQELHVLQQISPEWNVWRPHSLTLELLAEVLSKLDSGRLIRPTKPKRRRESNEGEDEYPDASESLDEGEDEEIPSEEEAMKAREILNQILTEYPRTITKIDKWESDTAASEVAKKKQYLKEQARDELQAMRQGLR